MLKENLANFVTLLNAASGFTAIASLFLNKLNFFYLFLIIAIILDGLDGFLAGKFNIKKKIGIELDSLADSISFVLAPALLIYIKIFNKDFIGLIAGIFALIFGLYRLAIFNVSKKSNYFIGMPTPLFTAILIVISFLDITINKYFLALLFFFVSFLMISKIRFPKLRNIHKYIALFFLVIIGIFLLISVNKIIFAVFVNAFFFLFSLYLLFFDRSVRKNFFIFIYFIVLLIVILLSLKNYDYLIVFPMLYALIFSFLIQFSFER